MFEKVVKRIDASSASKDNDHQAFYDLLTFELGFRSEDRSLSKILAQLGESGKLDARSAEIVADAVKRLQTVDALLTAHGL